MKRFAKFVSATALVAVAALVFYGNPVPTCQTYPFCPDDTASK